MAVTVFPETDVVGVWQVTVAPVGSVINQLIAPVGATAKPNPDTVVVKNVVPASCGFGEAVTEIPGVCLFTVRVMEPLFAT